MPKKSYDLFQAEVALNTHLLGDAKQGKKEAALSEFKEKISDVLKPDHDDYDLHKWLKARTYDVDKAAEMYRASMAYRAKMKLDTLVDDYDPPEVLKKYLTGGFCGYDKEGSPVMVDMYGQLDMKGLMYSARKLDLEKTKLVRLEKIVRDWRERCKKTGKRMDGMTVIADMEGAGTKMLWRPGMQMYLYLAKVLEDNYPEMMKRMFIVNAPGIFPLIYKLGRPLLTAETRNKINVLGSNFQDTLLKYVDPEVLPMFLGGVKTDPDGNPKCVTFLCQGGEVPKEYFLQDKENDDQLETRSITRGDKLCLTYEVSKPGSVLRWEFKTDDFDIGFGVNVLRDGKRETVKPVERVNSHILPEDGSLTCRQTGTYEVVFDNSFSWARGKSVKFMVEVIGPVEEGIHTEIKELLQRRTSGET